MTVDLVGCDLVVERSHGRLLRQRVAEPDLLGNDPAECVDEPIVDIVRHEPALAGRTALTRAQEGRFQAGLRGRLQIGVVENDEGPVAAHLE